MTKPAAARETWTDDQLKSYRDNYANPDLCVVLRCNQCGKKWSIYPHRVMGPVWCECGNQDDGNCLRDWPQGRFGNYTLVKASIERLYMDTPFGK